MKEVTLIQQNRIRTGNKNVDIFKRKKDTRNHRTETTIKKNYKKNIHFWKYITPPYQSRVLYNYEESPKCHEREAHRLKINSQKSTSPKGGYFLVGNLVPSSRLFHKSNPKQFLGCSTASQTHSTLISQLTVQKCNPHLPSIYVRCTKEITRICPFSLTIGL